VWQCCIACRSIQPACSLCTGGPEASAAVPVVAECETVSMLEERFVLQCFAHATAYEYYLL